MTFCSNAHKNFGFKYLSYKNYQTYKPTNYQTYKPTNYQTQKKSLYNMDNRVRTRELAYTSN